MPHDSTHKPPAAPWQDAATFARGLLMGAADVVPGVSGGTVALIVGIYHRLVTAISRVDVQFLRHVLAGRFRQAAEHLDARFLAALAAGIFSGVLCLGGLIKSLLEEGSQTRPLTLAAFLGAILASSILVGAAIRPRGPVHTLLTLALAAAGAVFAFWLTGLPALAEVASQPSWGYVFFCGVVAICAMILPGISGAYILVILGLYNYLLGLVVGVPRGEATPQSLATIGVFLAGCAAGLTAFTKLLRWMLTRWEAETMALLCGFMLGSLRKIWPLDGFPPWLDAKAASCGAAAAIALAAVLLLERLAAATK